MAFLFRPVGTFLLAVGVATCSDSPTAPKTQPTPAPEVRSGTIELQPVLSAPAQFAEEHRVDFGIAYDSLHVVIRGLPDTTKVVKDTAMFFTEAATALTLDVTVPVQADGQQFEAEIAFTSGGKPDFAGQGTVLSHSATTSALTPQQIPVSYVGPGASVSRITVAPKDVTSLSTRTITFKVSATDSAGNPTAVPPLDWSSSNTNVATVSNAGVLYPAGIRGSVKIAAVSPTGKSDTASAAITPPAASIVLLSGGGQMGRFGTTLANPAVVQVNASDGAGVPGVTVLFSAPAGGRVGATSVTTDTSGRASTTLTLADTPGAQSFAATADGFTVAIPATATAGTGASIAAVSGDGQAGRVGQPLFLPFVVAVSDSSGNATPGVVVSWTAADGTIAATTTTDASGRTSAVMTLGTRAATASGTASLGNGQHVTFWAIANPGDPTQLAFATQPTNGTAGATLGPVVVSLLDQYGNQAAVASPVSLALGANPDGGTLTGTLTRNAVSGLATFNDLKIDKNAAGYTLLAASGSLPAATSTPFSLAVGTPTQLAIVSGVDGQTATVNTAVPTAPSVKITDANGNPVSGVPVTFAPAAGSGTVVPSAPVTTNSLGVATLTSWTLGQTAGAQSLTVSTPGVPSVSVHATAQAAAAAKLAITTQPPSNATSGLPLSRQPVIQVEDQFGNAAVSTLSVTVAASAGTMLGTHSISANPTTGIAAFTDIGITGTGSVTLTFSAPGVQSVTSTAIAVSSSGPTQLLLSNTPTSFSLQAGAAPQNPPMLKVADVAGAGVAGVPVRFVTTQAVNGSPVTVKDTTINSDQNGGIAYTSLALTTAGVYTVTATSTSVAGASLAVTITVTPAAATKYLVVATTMSPKILSQTTVTATFADQFGNAVPTANRTVNWSLTGPGTLSAASSVTNAQGQATVTYNAPPSAGASATVTATDAATASITGSTGLTAQAGGATKLALTAQPANGMDRGTLGTFTVQLEDAGGNAVTIPGVTVTPALTASPVGGQQLAGFIAGTTDATGKVSFSGLAVAGVVGNYTLSFGATGFTAATATVSITAGSAKALAFTQSPLNLVSGSTMAVAVGVVDADGNSVTTATGAQSVGVQLQLVGGTAGAVLTGGAANTLNGVATFGAVGINLAGTGYRLQTTNSANLTNVTSGPFDVGAGVATQMTIITGVDGQTAQAGSAVGTPPAVKVTDANNNPVAGDSITFTAAAGNGAVSPGSAVTSNAAGVATITSWTLGTAAGPESLTVKAKGLSPVVIHATATSATATKLAFTVPAGATSYSATAGAAIGTPQVTVAIEDQYGNIVTTSTANVSVALTQPNGATLSGTTTAAAVNGVAAFANLSINKASLYTLTATSGGLTAATSLPIAIAVGAPTAMAAFDGTASLPPATVATATSAPPAVVVTDANGNQVSGIAVTFTVTAGGGTVSSPSQANVASATVSTDANGRATLTAWTLGAVAGADSITATAANLPSVLFGTTAVAGAATQLAFSAQPSTTVAGSAIGPVKVRLLDAFGNLTSSNAQVSVTLGNNPGLDTLKGTLTQTAANGEAAFNDLKLVKAAGGYTLKAASGTLSAATSSGFSVTPGAASQLSFSAQPPANTIAGATMSPSIKVQVRDAFGNLLTTVTPVTLALGTNPTSGTLSGTLTQNAVAGEATFADLAISNAGSGYTIKATSGTATPAISNSFIIDGIVFVKQPANATEGSSLDTVRVQVIDQNGNAGTNPVTIAFGTNPSADTLAGTLTRNPVNGVAAFNDLKVNRSGINYTLTATSAGLPPAVSTAFNVTGPPMPGAKDTILMDLRQSMQSATNFTDALNLFTTAGGTPDNTPTRPAKDSAGWSFSSNFDGKGTHALRLDWAAAPLATDPGADLNDCGTATPPHCGDQGQRIVSYFATPKPTEVYFQYKGYLGKNPADPDGNGADNTFPLWPSSNSVKRFLILRDGVGGGATDRTDYTWERSYPSDPRVQIDSQNWGLTNTGSPWTPNSYITNDSLPAGGFAHGSSRAFTTTIYFKAASANGVANGVYKVWIDGVLVINRTDVPLDAYAIDRWQFPDEGHGFPAPVSEYFWDFLVWKPGS